METTLIPFDEILENAQDDLGLTNIEPYVSRMRNWIVRAEERIGSGVMIVMKKVTYTQDGVNWNGRYLYLPKDCYAPLYIYDDSTLVNNCAQENLGNRLLLPDLSDLESITLIYHGYMYDAEGNPAIRRSHLDAIMAYFKWKLFDIKAFLDPTRISRRVSVSYKDEWHEECAAARGEDVFFSNREEYAIFSTIWNFSTKDAQVYYPDDFMQELKDDNIVEPKESCVLKKVEKNINAYFWQYGNRITDISAAPGISQEFLDNSATTVDLVEFKQGRFFPYTQIGRIGFAIQGAGEAGFYKIYDTFNSDVTSLVFDTYYNPILDLDIYISKEWYSHSSILFKIKQ